MAKKKAQIKIKSVKKNIKTQKNIRNMKKNVTGKKNPPVFQIGNLELKPLLEKPTSAYDDLFEKKLSDQYKVFRDVKEHHVQTRRFLRILLILFVIILIAVLLLSFSAA
ncbi:MAG: hypothetical protein ACP5NV_03100 [Candidatus Woesearchaeota archaeon]